MRIAIVHNAVDADSRADDQDVMVQVAAISQALSQLGHRPVALACTLDLNHIKNELTWIQPDLVFNLVESLGGEGRLIHLFPALLDSMGLPYTGSCTESIWATSHKILAKERMVPAGIPTPPWWGPIPADIPSLHRSSSCTKENRWLVKSVWEHASLGLGDDASVSGATPESLTRILKDRAAELGNACFAEIYVPGREFNLSLLTGPNGPQILPPAEIVFEDYGPDRLPIVGYKAKWDVDSYEYHHTPRRFDFPPEDTLLLEGLRSLALQCWNIFGLKGYARVDFRVDPECQPRVLEVNTNPCMSPDAGFAAAISQAGIPYTEAISRIIMAAKRSLHP